MTSADTLIFKAVYPVIAVTGIVGNIINFIIVYRLWNHFRCFSYYFITQVVVDMCILAVSMARWCESLAKLRIEIPGEGHWLCKLDACFIYWTIAAAACLRAATSLQRMVSVVWPFSTGNTACMERLTILIIAGIIVTTMALQAPVLFGGVLSRLRECYLGSPKSLDTNAMAGLVQTWLNFVFTCAIPLSIMFISNLVLLSRLLQSAKASGIPGACTSRNDSSRGLFRLSKFGALSFVTVGSALAYCLTLTPAYIVEAFVVSGLVSGEEISDNAWAVLSLMVFSNSAVSVFIFLGSGARLRKEARVVLQRPRATGLSRNATFAHEDTFCNASVEDSKQMESPLSVGESSPWSGLLTSRSTITIFPTFSLLSNHRFLCWVAAEYKQAPKHVKLLCVTVNRIRHVFCCWFKKLKWDSCQLRLEKL